MTQPSTDPAAPKHFLHQPDWLAAILITAVTIGFHFYLLSNAGGFWRDEVNLINVATQHSLSEMMHDSFPLLMPLLVKGWSASGLAADDASMRFLGTLIGLATIAGLWLAALTAQRAPPLISLALFGLNSTAITFGDELRGYGLGSLMIVLMFAAAWHFLKRPDGKRALLLAAFAVLSVQSLYHNAVLVGAICLGAMAVCLRQKNLRAAVSALAAGLVAALSLLPYLPNFIAGHEATAVLRTGLSWPKFFHGLLEVLGFPWAQYIYVWGLLAVTVVVMAAMIACRKTSPENRSELVSAEDVQLFAGITVFLAAIGFLGFLWLTALPGQPWYFLPLIILVAASFDAFRATLSRRVQNIFLVGALATFAISLPVAKHDLNYRFTNLDTWATGLTAEAKPNDYAVIAPWFCGITFAHYYKGAMPWTTLPPIADHSMHRYDLVRDQMLTTNAVQPVLEKISTTLRSGQRVWLLAPTGVVKMPAPDSLPPADLPPPPLPGSGWSDDPYSWTWTMQTIHFLARHGKNFRQINSPEGGPRIAENLGLFVIDGWNDSGNAVPQDAK